MRQFLDTLKKYMHWACFLLFEGASLVLLFHFNPYQQSIFFGHATLAAGTLAQAQHNVQRHMHLGEENQRLMIENLRLQRRLELLRRQNSRPAADSAIVRLLADSTGLDTALRLIPARVVDNSLRRANNIIVINRGADHGVTPEMGVVCGTGVVGIVSQVSPRFSVVIPVLNSHSSISCRLAGTNHFGYLRWHGGDALRAVVEDVPRHAVVKPGERVETSGLSNVFPPGITLGTVERVANSKDGLAYELTVKLTADLGCVEHVAVVDDSRRDEMARLRREAEEALEGKKKK